MSIRASWRASIELARPDRDGAPRSRWRAPIELSSPATIPRNLAEPGRRLTHAAPIIVEQFHLSLL
jgi:hypothetical protein